MVKAKRILMDKKLVAEKGYREAKQARLAHAESFRQRSSTYPQGIQSGSSWHKNRISSVR
ncbi:MAG: hypothetical protein ABIF87_05080 [Pseudomonadota bacterium]